jgi:hypothetical protein
MIMEQCDQSSADREHTLASWDEASRSRSPYQSPDWHAACGWMGRTSLLEQGQPPSAVAAWVANPDGHYYHHPLPLLLGHRETPFVSAPPEVVALARSILDQDALVTVSPFGYRGGALAASPGGDHPDSLARLADRLLDHARQTGIGLVLSHYLFDEDDSDWIDALCALPEAIPIVMGADSVLDIRWDTMREYRRWLGKSRRGACPPVRDDGMVWQVTQAADNAGRADEVARLLHAHAARFDPRGSPPLALFDELLQAPDPSRLLFTASLPAGPVRSALLILRKRDVLYPKFFGTTEPRADYFQLTYTRLIDYAITNGYRRIEYGGGTHHAKVLRGARLRFALGVLWTSDPDHFACLQEVTHEISSSKLAHYGALARRWQIPDLPLDPRYAMLQESAITQE